MMEMVGPTAGEAVGAVAGQRFRSGADRWWDRATAETSYAKSGISHGVTHGLEELLVAGDQVATSEDADLGPGGVNGREGDFNAGRVTLELNGQALTLASKLVERSGCCHHAAAEDHDVVADALDLFE